LLALDEQDTNHPLIQELVELRTLLRKYEDGSDEATELATVQVHLLQSKLARGESERAAAAARVEADKAGAEAIVASKEAEQLRADLVRVRKEFRERLVDAERRAAGIESVGMSSDRVLSLTAKQASSLMDQNKKAAQEAEKAQQTAA